MAELPMVWCYASGRYYYSELTVLEPESAEAAQSVASESMPKAIATSVEALLPEILANDCKPLAHRPQT